LLIDDYFKEIEELISSSPFILSWDISKDKRSLNIGYIQGTISFIDQSILYFMEFVDVSRGIERYKYKYQYQDSTNEMIFRYDMAPHFSGISTFPHHKHIKTKNKSEQVIESNTPTLREVIDEICIIFSN